MTDVSRESRPRRLGLGLSLLGVVVAAVLVYGFWSSRRGGDDARALARRGKLLWVSSAGASSPSREGTTFVSLDAAPDLQAHLSGDDGQAFARALAAERFDGVALQPEAGARFQPGSVARRLLDAGTVEGLVGLYLSRELMLYGRDRLSDMPANYSTVLAAVARRMLQGERAPRVQSFPGLLRRVQHVEVMVLLRAGPRPRLWRSARGSSIARAFLTAVRVAARRWHEREQAMGDTLADALPALSVEVALLRNDGELGDRAPAFIDSVISPDHGVAYELKGSWRYLLPAATQEQGKGSAARALGQLLEDSGLPRDAGQDPFLRVSRLRVQTLAVSPPDALGERHVADPFDTVSDLVP